MSADIQIVPFAQGLHHAEKGAKKYCDACHKTPPFGDVFRIDVGIRHRILPATLRLCGRHINELIRRLADHDAT